MKTGMASAPGTAGLLFAVALQIAGGVASGQTPITLTDIETLASRNLDRCTSTLSAGEIATLKEFRDRAQNDTALAGLADSKPPSAALVRKALSCPGARGLSETEQRQFGGVDQSSILWGLTDFIVKRAAEELDDWLFRRLKETICSPPDAKDPVFRPQPVLSNSCKVIIASELIELVQAPTLLRASAQADLRELPASATEELRRVVFLLHQESKPRDSAAAAGFIGRAAAELIAGTDIAGALARPARSPAAALLGITEPASARLYQMSFVLEAAHEGEKLLVPNTEEAWRQVILALAVNAGDRNLWRKDGIGLTRLASSGGLQDVRSLLTETDALVSASKNLAAARATGDKAQILKALGAVFDEGLILAKRWLSLCQDPACQEIVGTLSDLARLGAAAVQGDYAAAVIELFAAIEQRLHESFPPEARRAIAFVVSLATVTDATSAANVISAFAAPRGGYRLKRDRHGIYFRVNAYAGVAGGYETVEGERAKAVSAWVPVGVEVGHGHVLNGSLGLFGQVIDLGVLASYRFGTDKTESRPEVGVKQVFSPGAFLVFGFGKIPLSVGVGISYAPQLRVLKPGAASEGTETKADAKRYSLAIGLDIPLFP